VRSKSVLVGTDDGHELLGVSSIAWNPDGILGSIDKSHVSKGERES
jgi:hypothetical protein